MRARMQGCNGVRSADWEAESEVASLASHTGSSCQTPVTAPTSSHVMQIADQAAPSIRDSISLAEFPHSWGQNSVVSLYCGSLRIVLNSLLSDCSY